jgi:hypothetical protein
MQNINDPINEKNRFSDKSAPGNGYGTDTFKALLDFAEH